MTTRAPERPRSPPRVGLALAGGGPQGAVYEIGALRALDEALDGLRLNDLDIYVGVSAGAFVAALLTNGLTTAEMCRGVVSQSASEDLFSPRTFFTPAFGNWLRSGLRAPRLLVETIGTLLENPADESIVSALLRLTQALPVGVFDNDPIQRYLESVFTRKGRTDDFRELKGKLIVVAADLDSGKAVRLGGPGFDHVPISRAVTASGALPGFYSPVEIDGRYYVDGVLLKTLHASVALDHGVDLLFGINPIAPVDTVDAVARGVMKRGKLVDRGLPMVLSQTFRTLIHSRMKTGFSRYRRRYPDADIVLVEPRRDDYVMFFTNVFSFRARKAICEHAYRATLRALRDGREKWEPKLTRHGITIRDEVVMDEERDLWKSVGLDDAGSAALLVDRLNGLLDRVESLSVSA